MYLYLNTQDPANFRLAAVFTELLKPYSMHVVKHHW